MVARMRLLPLLVILLVAVCTFSGVADGRGVATGGDVIAKLPDDDKSSDHFEDPGTGDDEAKAPPALHGGTCTSESGPVIARLAASGEDGDHEYTLIVENGGGKSQLEVTIKTSEGLKADPADAFKLKKGETKSVTISVIDKEAAKLGGRINISWGEGDCYVELSAEHMGESLTHPSYMALLNSQGTFALVLGGSLVFVLILGVAGVWGCVSWRAHARRHGDAEAKYQELEMTLPAAAVSKQDDGMSPSADGWDEVWEDDDWQDTEAVRTSSSSVTLSGNGLNARRANKDGWDSSWDD